MSQLKQDDIVSLVNEHDFDCTFKFDSNDYTVPAKGSILVKRYIADHGIRKTRKKIDEEYIYPLTVTELENPIITNGQVSVNNQDEVNFLRARIAELEAASGTKYQEQSEDPIQQESPKRRGRPAKVY